MACVLVFLFLSESMGFGNRIFFGFDCGIDPSCWMSGELQLRPLSQDLFSLQVRYILRVPGNIFLHETGIISRANLN